METAAERNDRGVGTMLAEALRAKSEEIGKEYSYRDLERDSGVSFSFVSKVVNGKAAPSRATLRKWAKALDPYLDLDAALAMIGYLPDDPEKAAVMREMMHWTRDQWRTFMQRARRQIDIDAAQIDGLEPEPC